MAPSLSFLEETTSSSFDSEAADSDNPVAIILDTQLVPVSTSRLTLNGIGVRQRTLV
jgi:hypothetical protein